MKQHIENSVQIALTKLQEQHELSAVPAYVQIDRTKDKQHGDYATNIALVTAKLTQQKPRHIAERIVALLPSSPYIEKVEIAGPGFINFFLSPKAFNDVIVQIAEEKENYGKSKMGRGKRVLLEFVSSNPTGPLHVGHGRHAAFGAVVANLLDAVGFSTYREYYVNDAGRQMDILATSVWLRYLGLSGENLVFPANAYRGGYVIEIAEKTKAQHGQAFFVPTQQVFNHLPLDEPEGGDKEIYIDAVVTRAKELLKDHYQTLFNLALNYILNDMRDDLAEFGVIYDNWFSERQFVSSEVADDLLQKLTAKGHVYEQDGALWFRSTEFGDEKDRVLVRSNGQRTYFANDVAYHLNKFERNFDICINIFGADHHGYVPRMRAAMAASGINPERLIHLIVQFVTLYRNGQQVQMSTRGGNFVTLRELRNEVGNDAARFFYVMRKAEQHMDFDLDLAKSQSNENPVYYVQYAYARICSVFKQLAEKEWLFDEKLGLSQLPLLQEPQERQLQNTLSYYPELITKAALEYEPHLLTNYLRELAADFHAYYNASQFLVEDVNLRNARLVLVSAAKQVFLNGCGLLGVSTPESM